MEPRAKAPSHRTELFCIREGPSGEWPCTADFVAAAAATNRPLYPDPADRGADGPGRRTGALGGGLAAPLWLRGRGCRRCRQCLCVSARASGARPAVLVSAHTDTVFPAGTDLAVRYDEYQRRIYGPGLGDNSTGVAAMLVAGQAAAPAAASARGYLVCGQHGRRRQRQPARHARRGRSAAAGQLGAAIVIEGMGLPRVVSRALGSRRYRIGVTAPGGHSWSDYGAASAVHVLVNLAAELTRLRPPAAPRTTFNVGVISGGTSVNTIAQAAELELDLRSEEPGSAGCVGDCRCSISCSAIRRHAGGRPGSLSTPS